MRIFIQKIQQRYNKLSEQLKASLWFALCTFFQKGITIISTPIFTRIMSEEAYGKYSVFNSWMGIISIIVTLNLFSGVYIQGLVKFSDREKILSSSMQGLNLVLCVGWTIVYLLFRDFFNGLFSLSTEQMLLMLSMIWLSAVFTFWSVEQRVTLQYKELIFFTVISSVLQLFLGVLLVFNMRDAVNARIISTAIVYFLCYIRLFFKQIRKGKVFFSPEFWGYALRFNIPLLPHYLSSIVLTSADRIMISNMVDDSKAGIYSLAYSIASMLIVVNTALIQSIEPWIYRQIKDRTTDRIRGIAYPAFLLVIIMNIGVIAFAPEVVIIFAPSSYYEAIYAIPPIAMSVFFIFLYTFFATFEFYYEKTSFISIATVAGAILNVVLNMVLIPRVGYIAAAYTTLICYVVYSWGHYAVSYYIYRKSGGRNYPYRLRDMLAFSSVFILLGFVFLSVYNYRLIRMGIIVVMGVIIIIKRKSFKELFIRIRGLNNNE